MCVVYDDIINLYAHANLYSEIIASLLRMVCFTIHFRVINFNGDSKQCVRCFVTVRSIVFLIYVVIVLRINDSVFIVISAIKAR